MKKLSIVQLVVIFLCLIFLGSVIWFGSFGDEQENFAAGWLISQGLVPYRDFFFHHTPFPFFISRLLFPFAQNAYWLFRLLMLLLHMGVWLYLVKIFPKQTTWAVALGVVLVGLGVPTFLLQMFLADTLASLALIVLLSVWAVYFTQKSLQPKQLFWITVGCIFVSIWSSVTTIMSVGVVLVSSICLLGWSGVKNFVGEIHWQNIFLGILLLVVFPLAYAVTGNWKEFYWSVFEYNNKHYLSYRLTEEHAAESPNFIVTVVRNYFDFVSTSGGKVVFGLYRFILTSKGSLVAFLSHKSLSLMGQHMAVGVDSLRSVVATYESLAVITLFLLLISCLFWNRKWFIPVILLSITLRSRTNEIFHLSPFYLSLWIGLSVTLVWAVQTQKKNLTILSGALYISWCALLLPSVIAHLQQRTPIILPEMRQQAATIQKYIQPNDRLLILGGNTMYYALTGHLPATRQMYYLPWFAIVPEMHDEVMQTVIDKKAGVIVIEDFVESYESSHFAYDIAQRVRSDYELVENKVFVATASSHQTKE